MKHVAAAGGVGCPGLEVAGKSATVNPSRAQGKES